MRMIGSKNWLAWGAATKITAPIWVLHNSSNEQNSSIRLETNDKDLDYWYLFSGSSLLQTNLYRGRRSSQWWIRHFLPPNTESPSFPWQTNDQNWWSGSGIRKMWNEKYEKYWERIGRADSTSYICYWRRNVVPISGEDVCFVLQQLLFVNDRTR